MRETTTPNLPNRRNDRVVGAFAVKCAKRQHHTCQTGKTTASFGAFDHERANDAVVSPVRQVGCGRFAGSARFGTVVARV
jgi:hypothetical protein